MLVAKLSLGALALNDVWFGGQTMNPWLLEEGASGSSAGPGAATAAGLVGFAIGSETDGSIVSPSMRCGVTGLRPTFGRVPRTGAMTLCWSLDKLGPMARSVEDTLLVLRAITGPDQNEKVEATRPASPATSTTTPPPVKGIRVGYIPAWLAEPPATDVDRAATRSGQRSSAWSRSPSSHSRLALRLARPHPLRRSRRRLRRAHLVHGKQTSSACRTADAWPNTFRQARFLSAVDFVQADRLRRKVAQHMAEVFTKVDVLLVPSLRDEMLTLTNFTGHPSLTLRAGFVEVSQARSDWAPDPQHPLPKFNPPRRVPHGVTLIGRLFDEGILGRVGVALERAFNVTSERPKGFS